jgi:mono/diheme cytochrome c family protein
MEMSILRSVRSALVVAAFVAMALCASATALAEADGAADRTLLEQGRATYERICFACHTMTPPPRNAPPIVGLAAHLRARFANRDDAVAHIVDYVRAPSAAKSVLPPQAIQRWGVMPPLALPEAELRAVASWLWQQYDPAFQHQMPGMGMGMGGPPPGRGPRGP